MKMNWNYIGGIFDGEGWIALKEKSVVVGITNTDLRMLELVKDFIERELECKCYIYKKASSTRKKEWKICYELVIGYQYDVKKFLEKMIKADQAVGKSKIDILYKDRDNKTAYDLCVELIGVYKGLIAAESDPATKEVLQKKIDMYKEIKILLSELQTN